MANKPRFASVVRFFQQQLRSPKKRDPERAFDKLQPRDGSAALPAGPALLPLQLIGALESDSDSDVDSIDRPTGAARQSSSDGTVAFLNRLQQDLEQASPEKPPTAAPEAARELLRSDSDVEIDAKETGVSLRAPLAASSATLAAPFEPEPEPQPEPQPKLQVDPQEAPKAPSVAPTSRLGSRTSQAWHTDQVQDMKELYRQFVTHLEQERAQLLQHIDGQNRVIQALRVSTANAESEDRDAEVRRLETALGAAAGRVRDLEAAQRDSDAQARLLQRQIDSLEVALRCAQEQAAESLAISQQLDATTRALRAAETSAAVAKDENARLKAELLAFRATPSLSNAAAAGPDELANVTPSFRTLGFSSRASLSTPLSRDLAGRSSVAESTASTPRPPAASSRVASVLLAGSDRDYVQLVTDTEASLRALSAEKDRLSAEYSRMPLAARSTAHRRRRLELEQRLESVDLELGQARSTLRALHAI